MDVLTHEMGHAFAGYTAMRNQPISAYYSEPTDIAEIHSMSMEQFAYPYAEYFFGDKADKFRFAHLQEALTFGAVALVAFGGDVAGQLFKVRLVIGKDLCVAARGHDIGSKGYDRVQLFDQMAIRAASEHGAILSNTDKIECEQNETFLL